ncbi:hypothetical protein [Salmonella phage NINP13076]|nr:hypothetical protein [Salmonella phage NINP13076]
MIKCALGIRSSRQIIWGMGLLGVDTSLAPRITEEFESLILHQMKKPDSVYNDKVSLRR